MRLNLPLPLSFGKNKHTGPYGIQYEKSPAPVMIICYSFNTSFYLTCLLLIEILSKINEIIRTYIFLPFVFFHNYTLPCSLPETPQGPTVSSSPPSARNSRPKVPKLCDINTDMMGLNCAKCRSSKASPTVTSLGLTFKPDLHQMPKSLKIHYSACLKLVRGHLIRDNSMKILLCQEEDWYE